MRHVIVLLAAATAAGVRLCEAAPSTSAPSTGAGRTATTLSIPAGTVVGKIVEDVEYFRGIPYAEAPTGSLRLRPPVRLSTFGTVQATGVGPSCPQMTGAVDNYLVEEVSTIPQVAAALEILSASPDTVSEDCLAISVMRPRGTAPNASLPVLFWMHGGGFDSGSPNAYNGSRIIPQSVAQGQPLVLVTVNYRLGGFGFLPGAEALADGAANLGLLDQRMGLEWVADNVAAFGGDPARVTIWGQSAGALSAFDQMALFDGDNAYGGRPLFRAAVLNSGSITSVEPADGPRGQAVFDAVAEAAGCAGAAPSEKLACLRAVDYETYLGATNSVPSPSSYYAPALSFCARPDGRVLTASPDVLAARGRFARVPIIVGDQEDEGTFFGTMHTNITTEAAFVSFLHDTLFRHATLAEVTGLLETYPYLNGTAGSPFGSGASSGPYPEYKRLSALLGDTTVALMRRVLLSWVPPDVPAWSYLATYDRGLPAMGTFHTDELPRLFYGRDGLSAAMRGRYIAFASAADPNAALAAAPGGFGARWPAWHENHELLEFGAGSAGVIPDDFRTPSYEYIKDHLFALRV